VKRFDPPLATNASRRSVPVGGRLYRRLVGAPCNGSDAQCDSAPGNGSDACPVFFGTTTEDEMFILLGAYFTD
jgi:hypothetical protein